MEGKPWHVVVLQEKGQYSYQVNSTTWMFLCHLGESWRFSFYRLEKILLDVVQSVSHVCLCDSPGLEHARLHFTIPLTLSQSLLKLISIELMKLSSHLVLSCPSLLLPQFSQHQGLLQWVGLSHQAAKVLEHQLQHQSFQWIVSTNFL